jgi:hypothetical protein
VNGQALCVVGVLLDDGGCDPEAARKVAVVEGRLGLLHENVGVASQPLPQPLWNAQL